MWNHRTAEMAAARKAELEAIGDKQERIDRVAHDLSTGRHRYSVLDTETLSELLGVNFDDAADGSWCHFQYVYRTTPEDDVSCVFPLAENVDLLRDKIGKTRYERLAKRAGTIIATGTGSDLTLTTKEERFLRYEYQLKHGGDDGPTLASKTLLATTGVELRFEATSGWMQTIAHSHRDLSVAKADSSSISAQNLIPIPIGR